MEALQPAGSFKNRGIGIACQHYVAEGAKRLISSSGGNAGIATAYCGSQLGVDVTVIVPENAPQTAIDVIDSFGATVIVRGATWMEANSHAESLCDENSKLIHPFDDPLLWRGHATLIDEVVNAGLNPDCVIVSVGGGGLLSGIAQGLEKNKLNDTHIVAVETSGAASLRYAIQAQKPAQLSDINTIANTLGAKQVCQRAFDVTREFSVTSHIVSDREALDACFKFLDDHRVLVEPACGASLSAAYNKQSVLANYNKILIVVCGGMGVSLQQLKHWDTALK